jgi:excisionase family DNA binding protein
MDHADGFSGGRAGVRDFSERWQSGFPESPPQDHDGPRRVQRLLSPVQVAAYLGLRDRFAVYRLVASGRLPGLRLANKLRVDLRDLDTMIENAKAGGTPRSTHPTDRRVSRPVPQRLAPRPVRRRAVTVSVTVAPGSA